MHTVTPTKQMDTTPLKDAISFSVVLVMFGSNTICMTNSQAAKQKLHNKKHQIPKVNR